MLYLFAKYLVRSALLLYCRKIIFSDKAALLRQGPLLLACNHPNSFFDAMLLGAYFKQPVHFLARGDAFKKHWPGKILTALKAIPVYRLREGKEYLGLNAATFHKCVTILKNGGIVLMFSEGDCRNEWRLRPLKKGTARIALKVWEDENLDAPFCILPVSFNYSSFTALRKNVVINFGRPITKQQLSMELPRAAQIVELNSILYNQINNGLLKDNGDTGSVQFILSNPSLFSGEGAPLIQVLEQKYKFISDSTAAPLLLKMREDKTYAATTGARSAAWITAVLLLMPALTGFLLHIPLYILLQSVIKKKTAGTVFYHSVLFAVLLLIYPVYMLAGAVIIWKMAGGMPLAICIIAFPLLALSYTLWRDAVTRLRNYRRLSPTERIQLADVLTATK